MSAQGGVTRLGVSGALIDGIVVRGDVELTDGRVSTCGLPPGGPGLAVPGFIDLQVNGFAGVNLVDADRAGYRRAGAALAATGVTAYRPTFVSAPGAAIVAALRTLAGVAEPAAGPRILPAHLEGPFLSVPRRGAHRRRHLAEVSIPTADELCDAGPVGMMTVAPELDGCLELIGHLGRRGVVVSLGHSDASAAAANAAFDAGAVAVTHVFNAMRPLSARDPGLAGAALGRPGVVLMAIIDGVHLADETVAVLVAAARDRVCLVTDATAAAAAGAGDGDGELRLGDQRVLVTRGAARLVDGTLAGSVLSMDVAVRNLVAHGVGIEAAVGAATRVPGRLVAGAEMGRLRIGDVADVTVLDDDLRVTRTLVGGHEIHPG